MTFRIIPYIISYWHDIENFSKYYLNFDADEVEATGAEALFLLAISSTLDFALSVARTNNLELPLLARG